MHACCSFQFHCVQTLSPQQSFIQHQVLGLCIAGYQWDYVFDWTILKYQQTQQAGRPAVDPGSASRQRDDREGGVSNFARATAGERSSRR